MRVIDYSRCSVTTPEGVIPRGRVIFKSGVAAVWVEDRRKKTATRVLYATDAEFIPHATARTPNIIRLSSGVEWQVVQFHGGCGCGSPLKGYDTDKLLDPDFSAT